MTAEAPEKPKTLQEAAKTQAEMCIAFVEMARELSKTSTRTVHQELEDMMIVRMTQANLKQVASRGAVWGFKESQNMVQVFIHANQNEQDPEALLKRLGSLSNNMTEAAQSVQNGETNVPA